MATGRILELAGTLESHGIDVGELRGLQVELDVLETPPGIFSRLTRKAKDAAAKQWRHVVGELQESREAMGLLRRGVGGGEPLSAADKDKVKAQMLDLLKLVPAGVIAAANSALPIPGTGLLTPWILAKMGLMPSRWREAHLLAGLKKEADRLRAEGHTEEADKLMALEHALEQEADAREAAAHQAALLTHWDANQNGVWDVEERAEYAAEVARVRALVRQVGHQKRWYLSTDGQIFGPVRIAEVLTVPVEMLMLACYDGSSGWICLDDLREQNNEEPPQ